MSIQHKRVAAAVSAGVLAVTLSGCAGGAESDDALTEVVWAQPIPESLGYYPYIVASELGYFEEEGISVRLAPTSEDVSTAALVSNGSADIGAGSAGEVFYALAADPDLRVVYDAISISPEGIVVPEDSSIRDVTDLVGATIGVVSDEERALVAAAMGTVDLSVDDVNIVPIGGGPQVIANELDSGSFDGFAGSILDFGAVEAVGYTLRDILPEEITETPSAAFVIAPDADADAIQGFLRAWARATAYGLENPEELEEIVRARVPDEWENEEVAQAIFDRNLDLWQPREGGVYGRLDDAVWERAQTRLIDTDELDREIPVGDVLDNQFVDAANEGWE